MTSVGIIRALLSKEAHELRQRYIFKIVPMLNPDGVSHGSSRCSLMGIDLNRQWKKPIPTHHPTLYYTKALWTHITNQSPVLLSCDFHGHSRRKNVFFFGCESEIPLQPKDENAPQLLVRGVEKVGSHILPPINGYRSSLFFWRSSNEKRTTRTLLTYLLQNSILNRQKRLQLELCFFVS